MKSKLKIGDRIRVTVQRDTCALSGHFFRSGDEGVVVDGYYGTVLTERGGAFVNFDRDDANMFKSDDFINQPHSLIWDEEAEVINE